MQWFLQYDPDLYGEERPVRLLDSLLGESGVNLATVALRWAGANFPCWMGHSMEPDRPVVSTLPGTLA